MAASISRLPITPGSSQYAYPLVDDRPRTERPPWEPRTRFEMEREISDLKNTQRVLGDSVAWIVDTLLQDPGDVSSPAEGEEHAKKLKERKREALESLAYVRDALKGVVGTEEIDVERLVGEEEFRKRKARDR